MANHNKKKNIKQSVSMAYAKEAINQIKVNINFLNIDKHVKVLLFTSAISGEGKSTIAANVAFSMAESNKRTLIIDADLRHPTIHKIFNISNQRGLSEIIVNDINPHKYIKYILSSNIHIITSGLRPPNPSELLASNRMKNLIAELKNEYDYIIIDCPPILLVSDAIALSRDVDGVILVARHSYSTIQSVIDTRMALEKAKAPMVGIIFNDVVDTVTKYKGKYGVRKYYFDENREGIKKIARKSEKIKDEPGVQL